jgi:drug/metabolite transporter (DMT)-like permease
VNGLGAGLAALVVQLEVPFLVILGAVLLGERAYSAQSGWAS